VDDAGNSISYYKSRRFSIILKHFKIMQTTHGNYTYATRGHGEYLTSYLMPAKDMQTDVNSFDEVSEELCRHTPHPTASSSLCLLEMKKNSHIITKFYGEPAKGIVSCQKLLCNTCVMMPGSTKKDKVQVHMCKIGNTAIIMPTNTHEDYTLIVRAREISHYITRVGMQYKIMLHMENCTLCTIYQKPESSSPKSVENIHSSLFAGKQIYNAGPRIDVYQQIDRIKMTIGTVSADRYVEKFMVTMLFQSVPVLFQDSYKELKKTNGEFSHVIFSVPMYVLYVICKNLCSHIQISPQVF